MKATDSPGMYDPGYVSSLFDRMSKTYGVVNYLSSFGFTERWRRQCIQALPPISLSATGYDLMTGMGESWDFMLQKIDASGELKAVDLSDAMVQGARHKQKTIKNRRVTVIQADLLANSFPADSADFIISTFGVKTFSEEQCQVLAGEVYRLLKPGGKFSFIEVSEPDGWALKSLYLFYLNRVIPVVGWLFMGNAADYRMLGKYCARFRNCKNLYQYLAAHGLQVAYKEYFYGCATGVVGWKK